MLSNVNLLMTITSFTCDHRRLLINQQRRSMATAAKTTLYKELRRCFKLYHECIITLFLVFCAHWVGRNTADVDFFPSCQHATNYNHIQTVIQK